jgi:hypothetical protein
VEWEFIFDGYTYSGEGYSTESRVEAERQFSWDIDNALDSENHFPGYISQIAENPANNVWFFWWMNFFGVILTCTWDFRDRAEWAWGFRVSDEIIPRSSGAPEHTIQWLSIDTLTLPYY